ncbi:hypothetical protein F5Y04DRAFT_281816 [Hypomontagnella monticulosa]|nr:hypothetical protein F5Y04DRAFT_281816 [Hypomontagnella monticulosa]
MAIMARIFIVGLLALFHGVVHGAVLQMANKQEPVQDSLPRIDYAPMTTAGMPSETIITATWLFNLSTFSTIYINPSQPLRTTQVGHATALSSFTSIAPTRTSEITSRPLGPPVPSSYDDSPIMTDLPELPTGDFLGVQTLGSADIELSPREEPDGYGYGSGSDTTSVVNGGYGNSPEPSVLPPGAYGNQQPSAADDPIIITVTDPATEFVTLELRSSSSLTATSPADPTIVFVTVTSTPVVHPPAHNVTVTVTASKSTGIPPVFVTVTAAASSTPTNTAGYVYTTVTDLFSTSHASYTTYTVVYTPTTHPLPKPVTGNGVLGMDSRLNKHLLLAAAGMAMLGPWVLSSLGGLLALMLPTKSEVQRNAVGRTEKGGKFQGGNDEKRAVDQETNRLAGLHHDIGSSDCHLGNCPH